MLQRCFRPIKLFSEQLYRKRLHPPNAAKRTENPRIKVCAQIWQHVRHKQCNSSHQSKMNLTTDGFFATRACKEYAEVHDRSQHGTFLLVDNDLVVATYGSTSTYTPTWTTAPLDSEAGKLLMRFVQKHKLLDLGLVVRALPTTIPYGDTLPKTHPYLSLLHYQANENVDDDLDARYGTDSFVVVAFKFGFLKLKLSANVRASRGTRDSDDSPPRPTGDAAFADSVRSAFFKIRRTDTTQRFGRFLLACRTVPRRHQDERDIKSAADI